jgi:hypothetical protein
MTHRKNFRNPTVEEKKALSASFNNSPVKREFFNSCIEEARKEPTAQKGILKIKGSGISTCIKTDTPNVLHYWVHNLPDFKGTIEYKE